MNVINPPGETSNIHFYFLFALKDSSASISSGDILFIAFIDFSEYRITSKGMVLGDSLPLNSSDNKFVAGQLKCMVKDLGLWPLTWPISISLMHP